MSGSWQKKDWRKLLESYSSGEDSDEHDSLNVCSVQRRAGRITDLLHAAMPSLDPTRTGTLPMGMNDVDFIRRGLFDAIRERSQHLREFPASRAGAAAEPAFRVRQRLEPHLLTLRREVGRGEGARRIRDARVVGRDGSPVRGRGGRFAVAHAQGMWRGLTCAHHFFEDSLRRIFGGRKASFFLVDLSATGGGCGSSVRAA